MIERDSLRRIRQLYGEFINEAADELRIRPEVIAAIIQRETEGGLSRFLDIKGPAGRGDAGHGHGLMQIDIRSFPSFIASGDWRDPDKNIHFGAFVLAQKRGYLLKKTVGMGLTDHDIERAAIAAYNCGEGNVMKSIRASEDVDSRTAHGNYSAEVLRMAAIYVGLSAPAPES